MSSLKTSSLVKVLAECDILNHECTHVSVLILFFNIQLALPEGTQPRWGHSATAFNLSPGVVEFTMFGGCAKYVCGRDLHQQPKIAETTVVRLGEQITCSTVIELMNRCACCCHSHVHSDPI